MLLVLILSADNAWVKYDIKFICDSSGFSLKHFYFSYSVALQLLDVPIVSNLGIRMIPTFAAAMHVISCEGGHSKMSFRSLPLPPCFMGLWFLVCVSTKFLMEKFAPTN